MPADDQIYEKLPGASAIAESNSLGHDIQGGWPRATPARAPVIGTGHPLADICMLKHRPMAAEIQEGVAFFGRAGQAILKSLAAAAHRSR